MIIIDNNKCTSCGLCEEICHEHCIKLHDDSIKINYELCSTCTQCISICPHQALSWNGTSPVVNDKNLLPHPEQLAELFRERRTIRFFKKRKIERELLEEIMEHAIYAPTNNFNLRAIVVDDEDIIHELDQIVLRCVRSLYNAIYKPKIFYSLLKRIMSAHGGGDKVKVKIENGLANGSNFDVNIPAIALIVGDKRIALSIESAQYALYNIILYAQVIGIGTCLWGAGKIFLNRSNAAKKQLCLKRNEQILGMVLMGYPAIKFSNKVAGKRMNIKWINRYIGGN